MIYQRVGGSRDAFATDRGGGVLKKGMVIYQLWGEDGYLHEPGGMELEGKFEGVNSPSGEGSGRGHRGRGKCLHLEPQKQISDAFVVHCFNFVLSPKVRD